jgi:carbamoyltransferase
MNILGISAFYHDSAACLVQDGRIVAAAQEERFTRKKHDASFPHHAARYCVSEAGLQLSDLDLVAFYDKPLLKFDRLLETYVAYAPAGFKLFLMGLPLWLRQKLYIPRELDRGLGGAYCGRYLFTEHHEAHAASAFFPSPFEQAAILTLDGVGEWATGSIGVGRGNRIELLQELRFPHSLGLLYSAFTYFTGFKVNSGEYKLMGLAPYGQPVYRERILAHLLDLKEDGSFRLNMDYFAYCHDDVMTSPRLAELLDGPPRRPEAELTQREMDIAASIQSVTEEIVLRIARHAHALTGMEHLVLAGGVALNCTANGRLLREGPFRELWIQPAAGDAGAALGAALLVWHQLLERPRVPSASDSQQGSLLGPACRPADARAFLDSAGAVYHRYDDELSLCDVIAELIAAGRIVGHVAGRMEFGPRALGNRSILADARAPQMQSQLNRTIKLRESFRPFAPAVLREHAHAYFELREDQDSPYMLLCARVRSNEAGLESARAAIPAVTHVDGSARIQTVDPVRNPRLHRIVQAFERRTGCPVVINTSFNVRGEPIVNTPADALRCFLATDLDALVIEDCVLLKAEQIEVGPELRAAYLRELPPD